MKDLKVGDEESSRQPERNPSSLENGRERVSEERVKVMLYNSPRELNIPGSMELIPRTDNAPPNRPKRAFSAHREWRRLD
jgi:hypothetical protein